MNLKNIWRHSRLRFYILNTKWNYKFWLFAKKTYKTINYDVDVESFDMNFDYTLKQKKNRVSKKRFVGYMFDGNLFLDNPGIGHLVDNETRKSWIKKGLLQ